MRERILALSLGFGLGFGALVVTTQAFAGSEKLPDAPVIKEMGGAQLWLAQDNRIPTATQSCTERAAMLTLLNERFGEGRQGIGLAGSGQVMELFANPNSRSWSIIITDTKGRSCLLASGDGYEPHRELPGTPAALVRPAL